MGIDDAAIINVSMPFPIWVVGCIGLNAELTASIPVVGESNKNAAELAVKEANDAGGPDVRGTKYMIELVVEDDEDKPESAAAVQKLATAGVLAMIRDSKQKHPIVPRAAGLFLLTGFCIVCS